MPTLALIIGLWTTTCIQTQIAGNKQGWVKESYTFAESGKFEFKRIWHNDSQCNEEIGEDIETGSVALGHSLGGFFIAGKTFEADFSNATGTDLGAISVAEGKSIKIARGMLGSSMRNTMVSLFEYKKQ